MGDPEKTFHSDDEATLDEHGDRSTRELKQTSESEIQVDSGKPEESRARRGSRASFVVDEEAGRPPSGQDQPPVVDPGPKVIPASQRRGWLARLVVVPEVEEPKDYTRPTKWFITSIIAFGAVAAPLGSSIIFPSLQDITKELNTTAATTNFSVGVYMLSLAVFPLFWSSFCETLGRRPIYMISFTLFLVFNILAALSSSIAMFVVMRLLSGGSAASVQVVGAGTLADIWHVRERGRAMGFFYLGPLMGPLLAPILGGLLQIKWGWRSTLWFLTIYAFIALNLLAWCLPETLKSTKPMVDEAAERPNLSRMQTTESIRVQSKLWIKLVKRIFWEPFTIVKYLRFPAVAISVYYASITFGSLYTLQVGVQVTFSQSPYNFTPLQIGLSYIANSIGYLTASIIGGKWTDKIMAREARRANRLDEKGDLVYRPEDRMRENAWLAAFMYPCALIWYGWTAEKGLFYVVPLISNFFFGVGSMLVFGMVTTMLTEFMPKKASTGVALNNLIRNIFSFIGSVVAEPLISAIGDGWLFTGLGVIALASSSVIWAMRHYGPRWRKTMDMKMDI